MSRSARRRLSGVAALSWCWILSLPALSLAQTDPACSASFDGKELSIRNGRIERRWTVNHGKLIATSIRDLRTQAEWIDSTAVSAAASPVEQRLAFLQHWVSSPVEERSLVVDLSSAGPDKPGFQFRVFPNASAISVRRTGKAATVQQAQTEAAANVSGVESEPAAAKTDKAALRLDALEDLHIRSQHLKLTQVELFDQTDVHNELVNERHWLLQTNENLRLQGNLFVLEDVLTNSGLVFLKEAPLPHARPDKSDSDLEFEAPQRRLLLPDSVLGPDGHGYRLTTLVYSGGPSGITKALQEYQRQVRPYRAGRDGLFLSNTWGDRSRDARINQDFLQKEIAAGARLGVDVVQVDDGWQQGRTKNSAQAGGVWNGFWAADPGFWNVNRARFPNGLDPLISLARSYSMGFGLWFAPDSSNDFSNWERDAARLLEIHKTLGVNYFKIDGVKATSALSESRLDQFFNRVLSQSAGKVVFDLDVTAEIRPGYFGEMNVGPLFVENRYTDRHSYWPHQTLRNLWSLAQYVDPQRLRIEFLNQARNANLYVGDSLAPAEYSPAYLFATTMMANPLGWFEVSALSDKYFKELTPVVRSWKAERSQMQNGLIVPIGAMPDGVAWTGFLSVGSQSKDGYLLIFRERNGADRWSAQLPFLQGNFPNLTCLAGDGSGSIRQGRLDVKIPETLGFAWFRIGSPKQGQ